MIGVDPSSVRLAIAVTAPTGAYFYTKRLSPGTNKTAACADASYLIEEIINEHRIPGKPVYIYIERAVGGRGGYGSTIPQVQIVGSIMAVAGRYAKTTGDYFPVEFVTNTSWKKLVINYGNASKTLISSRLRSRWPKAYEAATNGRKSVDQDLIDASCINLYGRLLLQKERVRRERDEDLWLD